MPVGGRINRRDNLRSKKALTKSQVPEKNKKQLNEKNTGLNIIVEDKSKHDNVKGSCDNKKDLKLVETKEIFKYEYNNMDNLCLPSKGETKLVSPIKGSNKSPKKEESKASTDDIVVENLYDTLKRKEKADSNTETLKRRGRKKKEEVEIETSNAEENNLTKQIVENTPKKRGRIPKKKDDLEVVETFENEVIKDIEGNTQKDENNKTSKLNRRNAFQKGREERVDARIVIEKMDIDMELPGNRDSTEISESAGLNVESQENKPRFRASRIAKLVDYKEDCLNEEKEYPETESIARSGSRLLKNRKPFVIEKTDENETKMKIPGLVMLNNIRSRKSEMKPSKAQDEIIKGIEEKSNDFPLQKSAESTSNTNKSSPIDISGITKDLKIQKSEINSKPITKNFKENSPTKSMELLAEKPSVSSPKKKSKVGKVENNEESKKSNEKIPGLRMTADIKRRKSELLGAISDETERKPNVRQSIRSSKVPGLITSKVEAEPSRLRNSTMSSQLASESRHESEMDNSEKIKGGPDSSFVNTGSLSRSSIRSVAAVQKPKEKVTAKAGKPPMTSDKIPGLSTTSQLKKQKMENLVQKSATLDMNFKIKQKSDFSTTPSEDYPKKLGKEPTKVNLTPKSATLDSIKFLSFKDQQRPSSGILSKPSPFKRPVSCLDPSDDEADVKCKQSRIQVENRRQSVTFNREVEVKEIHGNSFNSNTDDGGGSGDEILDRLRHELERTKNRVVEKRVHNVNTSYSSQSNEFLKEKQRNIGPSVFAAEIAKKSSSDLSNLISNRIKIQSNSPPRDQIASGSRPQYHTSSVRITDQPKSGALKKIAPSTHKETLGNWKSFQQNNPVQSNRNLINPAANETINDVDDDSMEIDNNNNNNNNKPEESNKSSCLIM